ncbi:MAG: penicillin-binding protein 2 [bacterium]|nr:penicillin-binding protein 2 [bacterium]
MKNIYLEMRWKINFLGVVAIAFLSILFFRVLYIQLFKGLDYKKFLKKQIIKTEEMRSLRGSIYDRNGEILAFSLFRFSYFCFPKKIKNINEVRDFVTRKLKVSTADFDAKLKKNSNFFWIIRHDDTEVKKQDFPKGIGVISEEKRVYPSGNFASHVLGFTGVDNRGLSGVEYEFDLRLSGATLKIKNKIDARGRNFSSDKIFQIEENKSQNIYLTIDKNIQIIAEKHLEGMMRKSRSEKATVIIQDIKTGDILAMANRPDFNGNIEAKNLKNSAITDIYEPGSTVKILIAGAALDAELYSDIKDEVYCEKGKFKVYDHIIEDHDKKFENLSIQDILIYSSNIGMSKIGNKMGKNLLYKYLQRFGFGNYTGIELPGEAKGLLKKPLYWYDISSYIVAFGQGFGITPLQLVIAFSAIANNGLMMEPHIISKFEIDNKIKRVDKRKVRQILKPAICQDLIEAMKLVVIKGTAPDAQLYGYETAGKTGTAQKFDAKTKTYSKTKYIASFIGLFPADVPRFTILVVADSPQGVYWGGNVCGPVYRNIARDLAYYFRIPQNKL